MEGSKTTTTTREGAAGRAEGERTTTRAGRQSSNNNSNSSLAYQAEAQISERAREQVGENEPQQKRQRHVWQQQQQSLGQRRESGKRVGGDAGCRNRTDMHVCMCLCEIAQKEAKQLAEKKGKAKNGIRNTKQNDAQVTHIHVYGCMYVQQRQQHRCVASSLRRRRRAPTPSPLPI